jgi:hypothetical protein
MPHGGYHGVVKMGGKTVQQGSSAGSPVGQGGQYNPDGYATEMAGSSASTQNTQTAAQLQNQIEQQMSQIDDPREAYISAQANAGILSNLLEQEQQQNLANQVASSFAKGNVNKSDFTGNAGDNTFLGINLGSTPTAAATIINPITGEKIVTNKVREGMTSPEYAQYMSGLYNLNPSLMTKTFPAASGQFAKPMFAKVLETAQGIGKLPVIKQVKDFSNVGVNTLKEKITNILNPSSEGSEVSPTSRLDIDTPIITDKLENQFVNKPLEKEIDTNIEAIKQNKSKNKEDSLNTYFDQINALANQGNLSSSDYLVTQQLLRDILSKYNYGN